MFAVHYPVAKGTGVTCRFECSAAHYLLHLYLQKNTSENLQEKRPQSARAVCQLLAVGGKPSPLHAEGQKLNKT